MPRRGFDTMPLAIVGMACRLPGADDLEAYWRLIAEGQSAIATLPPERLDAELYFDPSKGILGKSYTRLGGIVREQPLDPQCHPVPEELHANVEVTQVTMLQVVAAACRDANLDPFAMAPRNTGVYIGHARASTLASDLNYAVRIDELAQHLYGIEPFDEWTSPARDRVARQLVERVRDANPRRRADGGPDVTGSAVARIVSQALALSGPYCVVDAACASGLYALAVAARALHSEQVDMAIVGAASYSNWLSVVLFCQAQALSATGSFPFDSRADGFVSSDGYAALIVKTLAQAIADGDRIHCTIAGMGTASDGRGRSLWAPRTEGQVEAFLRAYAGGVDPAGLQYVEAHGTSTQLGDATEIRSLTTALKDKLPPGRKIPLTSVKANIGHTVEAAGLAGLIKTVLAIERRVVPPAINFEHPNPYIEFDSTPFFVPTRAVEWTAPEGQVRRAGVNCFGIGGLNAHVVIEEYNGFGGAPVFVSAPTKGDDTEAVAIVGMGAVFPGARTANAFQQLLEIGTSAIVPVPPVRWDSRLYCSTQPHALFRSPTGLGGFVTEFAYDWRRHRIPPKQLESADPLRYMLLDGADQALQDAGYENKLFDRKRASVIVGTIIAGDFFSDLSLALRLPDLESHLRQSLAACGVDGEAAEEVVAEFRSACAKLRLTLDDVTGSFSSSTQASGIARTLDFMGGSFTIDAGEAASLAALNAARQMLLAGDCDMVLCAGAQRHMSIGCYEGYGLRGLLAADVVPENGGFVPGEGVAMLLLKRLSDARRDNDRIRAVLGPIGLATDPSPERAMKLAAERASAGRALNGPRPKPMASRNTRLIGHTLGASGMASVLEAVFALETDPTPGPIAVASSSFDGLAGQSILEPTVAAQPARSTDNVDWRVVRVSAPTPIEMQQRLARSMGEAAALFDAASSSRFAQGDSCRLAVVVESPDRLRQKLALAGGSFSQPGDWPALEEQGIFFGTAGPKPRVAFLFPGQGSQYEGMLRELIESVPSAAAGQREADVAMRQMGYPAFGDIAWRSDGTRAQDVWDIQVSLLLADTIVHAALTDMDIRPDVVAAHSYGEYPALVAAGVWTLEQAIRITRARCDLIHASDSCRGSLMATDAPPDVVTRAIATITGLVSIATHNAPDQTVFGGEYEAVSELDRRLVAGGFINRLLPVPRPFHTPVMAAVTEPFRKVIGNERLMPPTVPFLSSVTNRYVADPLDIRDNLAAQFTRPVFYVDLVRRLLNDGVNVFVEVGPSQVLTRLHRRILPPPARALTIAADNPKRPGLEQLLRVRAALESVGALQEPPASTLVIEQRPSAPAEQRPDPIVHFDATERRRTALRSQSFQATASETPAPQADVKPVFPAGAWNPDAMESFLVGFICEQTGYPKELVHLDADLEADLGIDSLKKAQLFGELQDRFDFPMQNTGPLSLEQYPTLRHVLHFMERLSTEHSEGPEPTTRPSAPTAQPSESAIAANERLMRRFVLRMRDVPLPLHAAQTAWRGAAMVLGDNGIADALRAQLEAEGVRVAAAPTAATVEAAAAEFEQRYRQQPILHLFLTTACDNDAANWLDEENVRQRRSRGLLLPFVVCQRWIRLLSDDGLLSSASLAAATRLGGDFGFGGRVAAPEGGAIAGLLKSIRREFQPLCVKVVDSPLGESPTLVAAWICSEVAARTPEVEVGYVRGQRRLVRAIPRPLRRRSAETGGEIEAGSVWVVTGGARGITALVARELGVRCGVNLFLLGSSPLDTVDPQCCRLSSEALAEHTEETMRAARHEGRNPADARLAMEKSVQVHRTMYELKELGVVATYLCCDVGNWEILSRTLDHVRRVGGPIHGIIHGAGVEAACRYENKQPKNVQATIGSKADAAAALVALTLEDPVRWFLTFGSVSGRFGGLGQTDYALASDMLAKQVQALRTRRPDCRAVNFDWPAWGETGMSMRPESRIALESAGYTFMRPQEGVEHLLDEIRTGAPEGEVLILDAARMIDLDHIMPGAEECAAWATLEPSVDAMPLIDGVQGLNPAHLIADVRFDPVSDPFLSDHQFKGQPVLPAVVALEALAEAASIVAGNRVSRFRDVRIESIFRFLSGNPRSCEVAAERAANGIAVHLHHAWWNRQGSLVDPTRVLVCGLAKEASETDLHVHVPALVAPDGDWCDMVYPSGDAEWVEHGWRFRGLQRFVLTAGEVWGEIVAPDPAAIGGTRVGAWIVPAVALDSCLVACAVHARLVLRAKQLPHRFDHVHLRQAPEIGETCTVQALLRDHSDGATCYDFVLYSASGTPLISVAGHRSSILTGREA